MTKIANNQVKTWGLIAGLCLFIAALSFKPSEPYLSQFLICNKNTQEDYCSGYDGSSCNGNPPCIWNSDGNNCAINSCSNTSLALCGNDDYNYCVEQDNECHNQRCYTHFTEDQVNNEIYPWSTYAYLPFLLLLGPFAELFSYRVAILFGILGRVVTRIMLLYGSSLLEMQLMQVAYSLGTAAEDVFSAFVYYVVDAQYYQTATSYIKAAALLSCVLSGVLGDILVVLYGCDMRTLLWISAAFVWAGFCIGLYVITPTTASTEQSKLPSQAPTTPQPTNLPSPPSAPSERSTPASKSFASYFVLDRQRTFSFGISNKLRRQSGEEGMRSLGAAAHSPVTTPMPHPYSYTAKPSITTVNATSMKEKVALFAKQFHYLSVACRSTPLLMMLMLWTVSNAIYSILYNYEVSVYEELNGSNEWNGSVLAIMLLAGSVGAMLPTWIHPHHHTLGGGIYEDFRLPKQQHQATPTVAMAALNIPLLTLAESELTIAVRLLLASLLACVTLLFFISSWELVGSITCLAVFFAVWQYINVTVYTRIAFHLKMAQMTSVLHLDNASSVLDNTLQSRSGSPLTLSHFLQGLAAPPQPQDEQEQQEEEEEQEERVNPLLKAMHRHGQGHGQGHSHSIESSSDRISGDGGGEHSNLLPVLPPTHLSSPGSSRHYSTTVHAQSISGTGMMDRRSSMSLEGVFLDETILTTPLPPHPITTNPVLYPYHPNILFPSPTRASPGPRSPGALSPGPRTTAGTTAGAIQHARQELEIDPPYSIAIVTIVAINVCIQIIIQALLFSVYEMELRVACWILVWIYLGNVAVYMIACAGWFGVRKLWKKVCGEGVNTEGKS